MELRAGPPAVILVVSDAPDVLRQVRSMLATSGYACLTAPTAAAALGLAAGEALSIDLVLLDLDLPGTPARELVDRLRALSPRTRVLYMLKPLAAGYLLSAVRDMLTRRDP